MRKRPFRLVFKRGQTAGPQPVFSLLVSAEMTPDFMKAAHHYGIWNDIIYADPKLEEARELQARQSELKAKKSRQRTEAFFKNVDAPTGTFLLLALLTYKIMKLIYIGPFKLIWWLYSAFRIQRTQIMRFHELLPGKTITTHTLTEIIEAEQSIQQSTETIELYVREALAYAGEAFEARRPL